MNKVVDLASVGTLVDLARFRPQSNIEIHPVILSGGIGSRLWPLSRSSLPKQLLKLTSERSMLQETVLRGVGDALFARPVLVCNQEHRFLIEEQLREIQVDPQRILLEPAAHNTGPAIAAAAFHLSDADPDALMLVQPSDHLIGDVEEFHRAVLKGAVAAGRGHLVTFGIKPLHAEPGYGYIQAGRKLDQAAEGIAHIERFVEKPDAETARRFVDSGLFFWNSGIFLMTARAYLEELQRLHPAMYEACDAAFKAGKEGVNCYALDAAAFARIPKLSIDRAVMEHTDRALIVPVSMGWNDVGSWRALKEVQGGDADGNVLQGDVIAEQVRDCYLRTDERLLVAIGVKDLTVVATDDAILVAHNQSAAEVGVIVERLKANNRPEPVHHRTVHRPWGYYRSVDGGERFQVKRIMVKPGGVLSLQKHYHRAEHWVVVQGTAKVQRGQDVILVRENESVHIPLGVEHRLENPGKLPLHLIEVQSGAYLGEDDIVRLADQYGRA